MESSELDTNRLELDRSRLQLDREKAKREARWLNQHLGVVITSIVALAAVAVTAFQGYVAYLTLITNREQRDQEINLARLEQDRLLNHDLREYVSNHLESIFSTNLQKRTRIKNLLLVTFPPEVTPPLFYK